MKACFYALVLFAVSLLAPADLSAKEACKPSCANLECRCTACGGYVGPCVEEGEKWVTSQIGCPRKKIETTRDAKSGASVTTVQCDPEKSRVPASERMTPH